jgi:large subunit ribosomal protein L22
MEARAIARYIHISPRKARVVADLVRGKTVEQALSILALTPKKASPILRKTILSAAANVKHDEESAKLDHAHLFVADVRVDSGPMQKRIRARAQGRAYRILKRTSHISVTVAPAR